MRSIAGSVPSSYRNETVRSSISVHDPDDGLSLVQLQVGILQDLGDGPRGLQPSRSDGDQHEELREPLCDQGEVRREQHDLTGRDAKATESE